MSDEVLNTIPEGQEESPSPIAWMAIVAVIVAIVAVIALLVYPQADDYTKEVLQLTGDPAKGRSIFVMNCIACHGEWADGDVGPSLRNVSERLSSRRLIHQVVSGETPPMPQFQPDPEAMADLLSYLKKL
ncbi:cytochrome c class I [Thalassoporum mexicanum PCC 7367]|uniref:c-type cytochrome n=1 Tax=Thalassoporum mexicanum TaxID=3457544 RepID=UPI00029FE54E|nr:cytochrome c [Pseudanabaena sp. PCC 7367]AFY70332.1 cytochrome c class I [Pseudanabaena sp. PCC 7367]